MDIDPVLTLSMALRANPGAYALLLGSGASQGVPAGWDVLVDLVKRVAKHAGYEGTDPIGWYREQSHGPVGYSSVLEDLTDTPEERVALLRPYFEPVGDDGATVAVEPSAAHRAIARLMQAGLVRVVVTTNFDRLMERALGEVGLAPTVLATPEAMAGARPLHLQRACIIKVNGDYLDPGFLNTGAELDRYEPPVDELLDQLFNEYGLVVAGWSAAWDKGLRAAIERCPTRRFGSYVVEPFDLSEEMTRLVANRDFHVVKRTADEFFIRLEEAVTALGDIDIAPPGSATIAVATAKRALSDGSAIRLHDLVARELQSVSRKIGDWPNSGNRAALEAIVERIDAALEVPLALVATLAYWGDRKTDELWLPTLLALADLRPQSGTSAFIDVRLYPSAALMYGAGVAMMAGGRVADLDRVLRRRVRDLMSGNTGPIASQLNVTRALSGLQTQNALDVAVEHIHGLLMPVLLGDLLLSPEQAERAYERLDLLLFVVAHDASGQGDPFVLGVPGRPRSAGSFGEIRPRAVVELEQETEDGSLHPWLAAGLFDGDAERLNAQLERYTTAYQRLLAMGYRDPSMPVHPSPFA